jgi:two-component system sensor kinase FixL
MTLHSLKPDSRRGLSAYGLAAAISALALCISAYLSNSYGEPVFMGLRVPIILAAYWGGFGPGVLAMSIEIVGANYFLLDPIGRFGGHSPRDQVKEMILIIGGVISVICERMHEDRRRAERGKEAAERGQRASAQLAAIVASSQDAIIGKTLDGTITSWNPASTRIFGYSEAEMIGRSISVLIPPKLQIEEDRMIWKLNAGQSIEPFEMPLLTKSGREIFISLSISPIRDTGGRVVGAAKIARDITAKKAAEAHLFVLQAELAHAARLNTMGEMSAALAHELNQPLTAIANYVNAVQRMLTDDAPAPKKLSLAREAVHKAADQVQRAGAIIRRLREFVEKRAVERNREDLNEIVRSAVALGFLGAADKNVTAKLMLAAEALPVSIDRIQIQQVLLNLIRNGIEAMAQSTHRVMTIATGQDGTNAFVTIRDTGAGMSAKILATLFKPFTTTKENGMGIGLTICQSIMASHGGSIHGQSDGAGGAVFDIQLPLLDGQQVIAASEGAAASGG